MHARMLAKRELDAQNRIIAATSTLAEKFSVEAPVSVKERQPDIAQMLRWESIADFLEALAGAHAEKEEQEAEAKAQAEADAKPKRKKEKHEE